MCQKESWGAIFATDNGSPFHTEGPTTENAQAWVVDVRAKGTKSNPCSDDRSELHPLVPGVGWQRSRRYAGARPRIHLQTMAPIRNMIRCWRGSQWSTSSMQADTCPVLGMPPMRRAAVRITINQSNYWFNVQTFIREDDSETQKKQISR